MNISPAHLVRQSVLIVPGWIQLIESLPLAVGGIGVAGGVVVLCNQPRRISNLWNCVPKHPVSGPCGHIIRSQTSRLTRCFDAVIEAGCEFADHANPDSFEIQVSRTPGFG